MLQHDGVAQQQVRGCEARDLVVREIPRHDSQQRAQRVLAYVAVDGTLGREFLVREQLVGMLGIPAVNIGNDRNLCLTPARELAHLTSDVLGKLVCALLVEVGGARQHGGALIDARRAPLLKGRRGAV